MKKIANDDEEERSETSFTPPGGIDERFPHLAAWVQERGWIEIGSDENSASFIRILDTGGMVWEGDNNYPSIDAAFQEADAALAELEAAGEI